jgi:hypothetical protein
MPRPATLGRGIGRHGRIAEGHRLIHPANLPIQQAAATESRQNRDKYV